MANTLNLGNGNWATKEGSLLAYNSENNNFKPLPFDFTRASSATVVNKAGLIETVGSGEPRIDFLGNTKGALKLEPQRSNVITYSEDFSNAYWTKARLSATSNSVISPDGTLNASKIFGDGTNSWKYINRNGFSLINTNYYTFSVFAKADTLNYIQLIASGATAENYQNFDLLNGVVGSGSGVFNAKIEAFVNGWYKCSMTVLATSTATSDLFIDLADSSTMSRAGSFLTSGGIYIYGAQLEEGSYPTSYIPTQGSAVTRLEDTCTNGGNEQVINSTEGVLYAEISALALTGVDSRISLSNKTLSNRVSFAYSPTASKAYIIVKLNSTTVINNLNVEIGNHLDTKKIAISYKSGDTKVYLNGSELLTSSVSFTGGVLNDLSFESANGSVKFYGNTKDVRVYNTALTDNELQQLTTI